VKKPALEVSGFSFSFDGAPALKSVSFEIEEGEYVSVLGPNGAGKTTLLKNIIGVLKGGQGAIKIGREETKDFGQRELAKKISYVPQADGSAYPFTVWEFILLSRYPYLNPFSEVTASDKREAEEALKTVHMSRFKDRDMHTLSSGERQKVMISSCLAQNAEIFLLDEPTAFLDPKHEEEINIILKGLNRERGITIVSVTHNLNLAAMISDRILALKGGRLVYFGSSGAFMEEGVLRSVYDKEFKLMPHPDRNINIILPEAAY